MFSNTIDRANDTAPALNDYFARHLFNPQWRALAKAIAEELFSNFPREDAWGFLRQIGRRMAEDLPIGRLETLPELEDAINATLNTICWGVAQINLAGHDILISHSAFPSLAAGDPAQSQWRSACEALLEGLYSAWFEAQGAAPNMRTRVEEGLDLQTIRLRIGC